MNMTKNPYIKTRIEELILSFLPCKVKILKIKPKTNCALANSQQYVKNIKLRCQVETVSSITRHSREGVLLFMKV